MITEHVNVEKNIYFIQFGINPKGRTPVGCAIDHSSIDWTAYDLTGGFGTYAEKSYDARSYNGINYYKADNITPLGLQSTCGTPTTYVASQSANDNGYNNSFSFLTLDPVTKEDKTIFAGWWDTSSHKSPDLSSSSSAC